MPVVDRASSGGRRPIGGHVDHPGGEAVEEGPEALEVLLGEAVARGRRVEDPMEGLEPDPPGRLVELEGEGPPVDRDDHAAFGCNPAGDAI